MATKIDVLRSSNDATVIERMMVVHHHNGRVSNWLHVPSPWKRDREARATSLGAPRHEMNKHGRNVASPRTEARMAVDAEEAVGEDAEADTITTVAAREGPFGTTRRTAAR